MECTEFMRFLEREPDGPLSPSAAGHLDDCSRCRLLFDDLEGIRLAGFEWATEQPEPSARVWQALRAQLESEGLIRQPQILGQAGRQPESHWRSWMQGWALRPALVGLPFLLAAVALLNVQSVVPSGQPGNSVGSIIQEEPAASAHAPLAEEVNRNLDTDIRRVMASLPDRSPSLANALQQNLTIVDNMIATCEKSVREQPDNPMVREYLYGAYQQKAVLLSTAMERTTLEVR